jgi:hypothetical protein
MRSLCLILIATVISGCAIKPKYAIQTATGLEVELSATTDKTFSLIDQYKHTVAQGEVKGKKVVFTLPSNMSPNTCYAIVDDKGTYLYGAKNGLSITSVYDYQQLLSQLKNSQNENSRCLRNQSVFTSGFQTAQSNLNSNNLFNGKTCDLPAQKEIPPFPETICGSYTQCQKLANDSCIKNLVDAEACGAALSQTSVHSSISSVGCGALLSSLNGEEYGIGAGVQDAITGYLDEHAKSMINEESYGKAAVTIGLRLALTYYRTESCKKNFLAAAYAPINSWYQTRDYIVNEPYYEQNKCNALINEFNLSYGKLSDNKKCIQGSEKSMTSLAIAVNKAKTSTSSPEICNLGI